MVLTNGELHLPGEIIRQGYLVVENGLIAEIGDMKDFTGGNSDERYDLAGGKVFPGFIDAHTHLGMWEDGLGFEGDDGNEDTEPCMPHLRGLDAVNPMDRCFEEALDAGITTVVTGPGSADVICGQMLAMKTWGHRVDDMVVREPLAMKMAMGENPKTTHHEKEQSPVTRMAIAGLIREQLFKAKRYLQEIERAQADEDLDEPEFDSKCEALIPLLEGKIPVHFHAHRADDMFTAIRIAKEFSLTYVLVHGTEGAAIAQDLARENAPVLVGPILCDRSKPELKALSPKLPAVLRAQGVKIALVTDHPVIPIQYLPLTAGLAVREGLAYEEAVKAITLYPAEICGIDDVVGSIAVGKHADLAVFAEDPLLLSAKPQMVMVNGNIVRRGSETYENHYLR